MRQETAAYLTKANQALEEARIVVDHGLAEAAGRAAYHAAYHAAQALIFESTGKAAKSHNGARSEFARLTKDDARFHRSLSTFLARAYSFKASADYAIGGDVGLNVDEARQAIEHALHFVAEIRGALTRAD